MFPVGDTAISGAWVEPEPLVEPPAPGGPTDARREPVAYVVQDSDRDPALVAVFGLGDPAGPKLLEPLQITDPQGLIAGTFAAAQARVLDASGLPRTEPPKPRAAQQLSLDMEGIAACTEGVKLDTESPGPLGYGREFWVVCEGKGHLVDGRTVEGKGAFRRPNLLLKLAPDGTRRSLMVRSVFELPGEIARHQETYGLEGVASGPKGHVYVAFQRGWPRAGDPKGFTRVGRFNPDDQSWAFAHYPLDRYAQNAPGPKSPKSSDEEAWVGVSELSRAPDGRLLVLERDNQRGDLARVQRIYAVDVGAMDFRGAGPLPVLKKELVYDIIDNGVRDPRYGVSIRKPEALGVLGAHQLLLLADDDGKRGSKKGTPFFFLRTR